uniref:Uncharacterized protein n=1 Tax=Myoviridae sp. ctvxP16 TaxID=2825205 RepID=A0A8S5UU22_9CAUD|nr:MAG TPA: hypothetical protein [Myoviridae sp. ctvxP16]
MVINNNKIAIFAQKIKVFENFLTFFQKWNFSRRF